MITPLPPTPSTPLLQQSIFGVSRGFMKVYKGFIKPFEAPQSNLKKKFKLIFCPRSDWDGKC